MPEQYCHYHASRGDGSQLKYLADWEMDPEHVSRGERFTGQGPGTNGNRGWRAFSIISKAGFTLHRVYYRPRGL